MDEEVKYLKSKFYYPNLQISPESPAQALHGPDQTPPATLPVELGMAGFEVAATPPCSEREAKMSPDSHVLCTGSLWNSISVF